MQGGSVTGGAGGSGGAGAGPGTNGTALGSGIFFQGDQSVTFGTGQTAGQVTDLEDVIADQMGSGGTHGNAHAASVTIAGSGTVKLGAANTYAGGTTLRGGILELGNSTAAGSGAITFAPGAAATLLLDAGVQPTNVIKGLINSSDRIDLRGLAPGAQASVSGHVLTITQAATTQTINLDPAQTYAADAFSSTSDGSGGVYLSLVHPLPGETFTIASEADLNAAITAVNGRSSNDVFNFTASFTLTTTVLPLILNTVENLTINGDGFAIDGGGSRGGLSWFRATSRSTT
jgi:autotransporter-associated beta strand protein